MKIVAKLEGYGHGYWMARWGDLAIRFADDVWRTPSDDCGPEVILYVCEDTGLVLHATDTKYNELPSQERFNRSLLEAKYSVDSWPKWKRRTMESRRG